MRPCDLWNFKNINDLYIGSGGSGRGAIRPWPPSKLAMEFGPLRGRRNNDSSVNFAKFKFFGPHHIDVGYGFWPPPARKATFEVLKGR